MDKAEKYSAMVDDFDNEECSYSSYITDNSCSENIKNNKNLYLPTWCFLSVLKIYELWKKVSERMGYEKCQELNYALTEKVIEYESEVCGVFGQDSHKLPVTFCSW